MRRHLVPALKAYGADVVGVFDVDAAKSSQLANELGARPTVSLTELLERPDVDCIVAACTPQGHESVIAAALARGVPVLVEKPPVCDLGSLKRLSTDSARAGVPVCVGMNYRHTPGFDALRQSVKAGGGPCHIQVQHLATTGAGPSWGLDRLRTLLLAQAVHALDMALALIGQCSSVTTTILDDGDRTSIFWTLSAERSLCNITVSNRAPGFRHVVTVLNNDGSVAELRNLDQIDVFSEAGYRAYQQVQTRRSPFADVLDRMGYASSVEAFLDAHVTTRPSQENLAQTVTLQAMEPTYVLIEQAIGCAAVTGKDSR